jgi:hypothetical protein
MSRYVDTPPADADAPGAFRFAEPGKLAGFLKCAGANDVREQVLYFQIEAPIAPREFWEMRSEISETLREKLAKLSPAQALSVAKEIKEAVAQFFPNNQMSFPAQMIIVTGRKPE